MSPLLGSQRTVHRYYWCRNHDPLRAGGAEHRGPERNIRADALDEFVFDQVGAALLRPDVLAGGDTAIAAATPTPNDELLAAELAASNGSSRQPPPEAVDSPTSTRPDCSTFFDDPPSYRHPSARTRGSRKGR